MYVHYATSTALMHPCGTMVLWYIVWCYSSLECGTERMRETDAVAEGAVGGGYGKKGPASGSAFQQANVIAFRLQAFPVPCTVGLPCSVQCRPSL